MNIDEQYVIFPIRANVHERESNRDKDTLMKKRFVICALLIAVSLTGCGKDKALEQYYSDMSDFADSLSVLKENIDTIDVNDPASGTELLSYLDAMDAEFQVLSEIEVPKQFASNEELADDAYTYMHEAVTLYHKYYDNPDSSTVTFDAAYENYTRAMKRVGYISTLLKGEVPDDADVEVTEEEILDFDPVTDDSVEE